MLKLRTDECDASSENSNEHYTTGFFNGSTEDWTGSNMTIATTEMMSSSEKSGENGGSG